MKSMVGRLRRFNGFLLVFHSNDEVTWITFFTQCSWHNQLLFGLLPPYHALWLILKTCVAFSTNKNQNRLVPTLDSCYIHLPWIQIGAVHCLRLRWSDKHGFGPMKFWLWLVDFVRRGFCVELPLGSLRLGLCWVVLQLMLDCRLMW